MKPAPEHREEVADWTPDEVEDGTQPPAYLPEDVPEGMEEVGDAGLPDPEPFEED